MAYVLPWWMQWAQAFALIVISGLGAWIAYKQTRIAAAKLNLDLYDKRFDVFQAARTFLISVVQHGDATPEDMNTFNWGVVDAGFLFEKEIEDYIKELRERVARLHYANQKLEHVADDDYQEREKWLDSVTKQFESLSNEPPMLIEKFRPYLRLGNI